MGLALLGLGETAVAVYSELLTRPERPLAEIARDIGRSPAEVGAALDALAAQALLRRSQTESEGWRPVSPEIALRRLVADVEADLLARQARVSELRDAVAAFVDTYQAQRQEIISSRVEQLESRDAIVSTLEEFSAGAQSEILALVTNRPSKEAIEDARESDDGTLARGVSVRSIYLTGFADKAFLGHVRRLVDAGAQARLTPTLPVRMLIFDRAVAVVAIDPSDPTLGAMVVRGRGLIAALVRLFELQWDAAADPFAGAVQAQPVADELSQMDREVLRLLAGGLKDESVARSLGVSVRTARRFIADLTERSGSGSRFELGVRAKEFGWL